MEDRISTQDKAKETFKRFWGSEPDSGAIQKYRFDVGDRVMMYSSRDVAVHGTVRWIGPVTPSKVSKLDKSVVFAGIETVSTV